LRGSGAIQQRSAETATDSRKATVIKGCSEGGNRSKAIADFDAHGDNTTAGDSGNSSSIGIGSDV
jgi:hypothetical protein